MRRRARRVRCPHVHRRRRRRVRPPHEPVRRRRCARPYRQIDRVLAPSRRPSRAQRVQAHPPVPLRVASGRSARPRPVGRARPAISRRPGRPACRSRHGSRRPVPNGAPQKSVAPMSARRRTCAATSPAHPTMATSAGPSGPFAVEHRPVGGQVAVDGEGLGRLGPGRGLSSSSRTPAGPRRSAAGVARPPRRRRRMVGPMCSSMVAGPVIQVMVPGGHPSGDLQHDGAEGRDQDVGRGCADLQGPERGGTSGSPRRSSPAPRPAGASGSRGTRACGGPACRTTGRTRSRSPSGGTARCPASAGRHWPPARSVPGPPASPGGGGRSVRRPCRSGCEGTSRDTAARVVSAS